MNTLFLVHQYWFKLQNKNGAALKIDSSIDKNRFDMLFIYKSLHSKQSSNLERDKETERGVSTEFLLDIQEGYRYKVLR